MDEGFTIEQIARRLKITPRTIRNYTAAGVFTPPPFRGADTRYGAAHLEQLLAIHALRKQGLQLAAIKEQFAAAAARVEPAAAVSAPAPTPAADPAPRDMSAYAVEHWERVVLVPGLELHVRADGGPLLQRLAKEICQAYGSRGESGR